MSFLTRRCYSASTQSTAAQVAAQFLASHSSTPVVRTQLLDANQYTLLAATLGRPAPIFPAAHSDSQPHSPKHALPPTYHLAYFTPAQPTEQLGLDGTDTSYNPPAPFTRRMWAGGELTWDRENLLRVGEEVTETTTVKTAVPKAMKAGKEMLVVGVEKEFRNKAGVAVVDKRNWVFQPHLTTPPVPPTLSPPIPLPAETSAHPYTRDLTQSQSTLFRFSALTFNAHKIHYDRAWCQTVEGHRDLVVHGPLNLVEMVDFWRDVVWAELEEGREGAEGIEGTGAEEVGNGKDKNGGKGKREREASKGDEVEGVRGKEELVPKRVTYRATHPLYVGEAYRICLGRMEDEAGKWDVRVLDGRGNLCMVGEIEGF